MTAIFFFFLHRDRVAQLSGDRTQHFILLYARSTAVAVTAAQYYITEHNATRRKTNKKTINKALFPLLQISNTSPFNALELEILQSFLGFHRQ